MNEAMALLLLSIALTACAGSSATQPMARASTRTLVPTTTRAAARLGPPNSRGLGFRRVDRPTEPPLARY